LPVLRSAQERLTLVVFWIALSSERCVCGFCQALDENRDEKVLSDILRRGNAPKRAGAYVSARKEIKLHNVNNVQYPRIPIYTNPYQNPIYHVFQRDVVLDRGVGRPRTYILEPTMCSTGLENQRVSQLKRGYPSMEKQWVSRPKRGYPSLENQRVSRPKRGLENQRISRPKRGYPSLEDQPAEAPLPNHGKADAPLPQHGKRPSIRAILHWANGYDKEPPM
jgi:hypothetical protein